MARKLTEDFIGTCQWCFGEYKVNSKHRVVLHGFTRPGYGYTIGQCRGVGHEPFEYSHELTEVRIEELKAEIVTNRATVAKIDAGKVNKVPNPYYLTPEELEKRRRGRFFQEPKENLEYFVRGHEQFDGVLYRLRINIENRIDYDLRTQAYFEQLLAEWKKGTVVGIDSPATGKTREMRDAFDPDKVAAKAEREAAKAARDAKPGKITIMLYRPSVEFQHLGQDQWDERMAAVQKHYDDVADFKKAVKAWAKATFPGKVWVGDSYVFDVQRIDASVKSGSWAAVNLKVDWQYLDDVIAMFPEGDAVVRKDQGPKDVRYFVRAEAFPEGLK